MISTRQTSKNYFRFVNIIFYVMLAGQIVLGLVFYYMNSQFDSTPANKLSDDVFIFVVPIFALSCLVGTYIFSKNKIGSLKRESDLINKMTEYKSLLIIRYALIEGASMFSLVVYFVTRNLSYLGLAGLLIIIFFYFKPTRERAIAKLELTSNEAYQVNDPNAEIAEVGYVSD